MCNCSIGKTKKIGSMKFNIKKSGTIAAGAIVGYAAAGKVLDFVPASIDDKIKGGAMVAVGLILPSLLNIKGMDDAILGASAGIALAGTRMLINSVSPDMANTLGINGIDQTNPAIGGYVYAAQDVYNPKPAASFPSTNMA